MKAYRLSLDELLVSTFEPIPTTEPMAALNDEWTGCDSACSGCGLNCALVANQGGI